MKSPNPAFRNVDVPLASTFMLMTRAGGEAYIEPVVERDRYGFTVKVGKPTDIQVAKNGTKLSRGANFRCLMSGTPITGDYIKAEGMAGRVGARLMAIVAEGGRGRVYLPPTPVMESIARQRACSSSPMLRRSSKRPNGLLLLPVRRAVRSRLLRVGRFREDYRALLRRSYRNGFTEALGSMQRASGAMRAASPMRWFLT